MSRRLVVGWVLTIVLGMLFLASAVAKFVRPQSLVESFTRWGLIHVLTPIAVGETLCATLFLMPRTHSLGVLLLSAYLGAATATHLSHNEPPIVPVGVLVLLWLTGWLRNPKLLGELIPERIP